MKEIDFRLDLLPHKNRLFRLAMGILLDSAEAEDTVEDTLIRAWEESRTTAIDNVAAYLTTVCRHLALDRAQLRSAQTVELTPEHDRAEEDDSLTHERYVHTLRLIQSLTEPQRSCILLRDVEGLSYQEIADALQLTLEQVKVNIHRGRAKVREMYSEQ